MRGPDPTLEAPRLFSGPKLQLVVAQFVPAGVYGEVRRFEWDGPLHPLAVPTPPEVFAVQFYQRIDSTVAFGQQELLQKSDAVWIGPLTYIRGKVVHVQDIRRLYPSRAGLAEKFESVGDTRAFLFGGSYATAFKKGEDVYFKRYASMTNDGQEPVSETDILDRNPYLDAESDEEA